MRWKRINVKNAVVCAFTAMVSMVGFAGSSQAAGYIKFEGIDGESLDRDHDKWINILSFGQATHQPGASAPVERNIRVDAALDSGSSALAKIARSGSTIGTVEVDLCEGTPTSVCDPNQVGDQHCYLKYKLTNVLIKSYSVSGATDAADSGRVPVSLALDYEGIEQTYIPPISQCPTEP